MKNTLNAKEFHFAKCEVLCLPKQNKTATVYLNVSFLAQSNEKRSVISKICTFLWLVCARFCTTRHASPLGIAFLGFGSSSHRCRDEVCVAIEDFFIYIKQDLNVYVKKMLSQRQKSFTQACQNLLTKNVFGEWYNLQQNLGKKKSVILTFYCGVCSLLQM